MTFSADDLDESNARQIEKRARVEWAWQFDGFTPQPQVNEAAARRIADETNDLIGNSRCRVLSRTITDWVES